MSRSHALFRAAGVMLIAVFVMAQAGAAQEERPPPAKPAATSQDATIYPVPNYGGDFRSRSYLTGIGADSGRSWRTAAFNSILM